MYRNDSFIHELIHVCYGERGDLEIVCDKRKSEIQKAMKLSISEANQLVTDFELLSPCSEMTYELYLFYCEKPLKNVRMISKSTCLPKTA